jgi:regulatory protein YycI of two-component signal transduction system YycFG
VDWSKIKTIFIITFLILDVYLLFQFMKIRDANKYEYVTEASIEEKLKVDEIQIEELPKATTKHPYLSAKPVTFTKSDLAKLKGQTALIKEPTAVLQMELEKPVQLSLKFEPSELSAFIKENIINGDQYQFWEMNEQENTITYFQQYEYMTLYKNISGMLTFHLNSDNQIVSYEQTYLGEIEKQAAKGDILSPLKAIETLHQKGELKPKSKITKIELGYSTLIQLAASQALAPTWRFVVDDQESLFVNAFEGQIIQFDSKEKTDVE